MSEAADLLNALEARGFAVVATGERLDVSPAGALSDEDRAAIRAHKPALLDLLARQEQKRLPAIHDTDDPWAKPTAPCAACGAVHWRVWCHDERKVWQWICNRCRPLVVYNRDGTVWRSDAP
jgi:hypothetical protein